MIMPNVSLSLRQQQQQRQQQRRAGGSESERQPREPRPTGMESRAGLKPSGGRADAGVALTSQQQQRDQRVGYKRKCNANEAEVGQGKKARACEDDSESERQVRGPSPTGMDSRAGLELSCNRAGANAALVLTQARQPKQQQRKRQRKTKQNNKKTCNSRK